MALGGFAGSGNEARVWRLANDGQVAPQALRLAEPNRPVTPRRDRPEPARALPDNPHLLTVGSRVDAGAATIAEVLPLLGGGSMAARLASAGPLSSQECVKVLFGIRDGLAALHAAGLVHLDVSPANIMLTTDGLPILCDTGGVVPADGQVVRRGTPPYTVPGADAAPSTDWVALGRVITELATGSPQSQTSHLSGNLQPAVTELLKGNDPLSRDLVHSGVESALGALAALDDRRLAVHQLNDVVPSQQRVTLDFAGSPNSESAPVQPATSARKLHGRSASWLAIIVSAISACAWVMAAGGNPTSDCADTSTRDWADDGQLGSGFVVIAVDTGESCPTSVRWSQSTGQMIVPTSDGLQRFAVGEPGDVLSFGDWDCNGTITPALTREGRFFVFANWPHDAPEEAREATEPRIGQTDAVC